MLPWHASSSGGSSSSSSSDLGEQWQQEEQQQQRAELGGQRAGTGVDVGSHADVCPPLVGSDVLRLYQYLRPAGSGSAGLQGAATGLHADLGLLTVSPVSGCSSGGRGSEDLGLLPFSPLSSLCVVDLSRSSQHPTAIPGGALFIYIYINKMLAMAVAVMVALMIIITSPHHQQRPTPAPAAPFTHSHWPPQG